MQKSLGIVVMAFLVVYGAMGLGLFLVQRSFIYFPPPDAAYAVPRTFSLTVPGAVVRVSERPLDGRRALIYLGGNAEDVSASFPTLDRAFPDRALYLLHYRGYTGSTGKPSEEALVGDAVLLFDRVAATHPDVVVVGRSLGSGVALQLAARRPVARLVLVAPFDSIVDLAARQYPYFPVRWLLQDKYESWRYAQQLQTPTLVLAAEHDEVIPAWSTQRLASRFPPGVATMQVLPGVGHNTISESPMYIPALRWAR
jgi:pimeloyl-ACP methyl ester carboxylesterase